MALARLKDALRLAVYFAATILVGSLIAPFLFWAAQAWAPDLARFEFETFFHRALLIAALVLLWPFLLWSNVRTLRDLQLERNPRAGRHVFGGFILSAIPLLCCGALFLSLGVYGWRHHFAVHSFGKIIAASIAVPLIEETFFRGLILGILLRTGHKDLSILATSALFAVVHFLKAPARTATIVTWSSGFHSIAQSFGQFADPMFVLAAFTTLFLIGWILADARIRTRSLWLPIGLHAGWIFASGLFKAAARRQTILLPWIGKNLLVGIVPLVVALLTWLILVLWLKHERARHL